MSEPSEYRVSSHEEITEVYALLSRTFKSGKTWPLAWRRHQLLQLARMFQENIKMVEDSMLADLGKPRMEVTVVEISSTVQAAVKATNFLEEWTKPEKPEVQEWQKSWDATVYKDPKGVVLMISPWNYPYIITFLPLIGAIAAGCPAVLKPSETSPHCSAVMAHLVAKYLDPDAYAVVQGGPSVATALLELRWDHIFFTGSTRVGRRVAAAAAQHITPLTLELGGKCPVYVDAGCDVELAAKRILYGKTQNAGQVCVTTDYALVHRSVKSEFETALKKVYHEFFPDGALSPNAQYSRIVNARHYNRLTGLIAKTKGKVIVGGGSNGDSIEPTIVSNVKLDDILMEDEIFGPILALIEVESLDEAIDIIGFRPSPLVVYAFTKSESTKQQLIQRTQSGALVLNDVFMQLTVDEAPFGGKGQSGYGAYFHKVSFDTFTHQRTSINVPPSMEAFYGYRYQPYTEEAYKIMTAGAHIEIPSA